MNEIDAILADMTTRERALTWLLAEARWWADHYGQALEPDSEVETPLGFPPWDARSGDSAP